MDQIGTNKPASWVNHSAKFSVNTKNDMAISVMYCFIVCVLFSNTENMLNNHRCDCYTSRKIYVNVIYHQTPNKHAKNVF